MSAQTLDTFPLMGARATVLASGDLTADAWEALQLDLAPGARSPRHTLDADKLFAVVAGTVTIEVGDETREVDGGPVWIPAGTPHCYRNTSDAPARMLVVVTGRSQVEFLRGMSRLTADGPPDPAAVAEHTAAFGVAILPAS
ncbi:cupin domain-containing protein [Actinomycetospora aeridis]|uniref:Cupin domain-containing protein n=1 Tax=Actinomycetospora aeridis TaxID=3129231 RepID=A0ABU8MXK6_9PSEU